MFKNRIALITTGALLLSVIIFSTCVGNNNEDKQESNAAAEETFISKYKFADFAGSASCRNCHKNIYEDHIKTGHFHTSEIATAQNIAGSFDTAKNKVFFSTGGQINMEKLDSGFYQTAYVKGKKRNCERFDIVVGAATQGQSYMSWDKNKLYQLPVTFFTRVNSWTNSPGYPNHIAFNRPITSRCLECHTTFAEKLSALNAEPELFDPHKMLLGVTCEKCHGPGAKHVDFQTKNIFAWVAVGVASIWFLAGLINWQNQTRRMLIQARKNWYILLFFSIFILPMGIFPAGNLMEAITLISFPVGSLASNVFATQEKTKTPIILFWCIIAAIITVSYNYG